MPTYEEDLAEWQAQQAAGELSPFAPPPVYGSPKLLEKGRALALEGVPLQLGGLFSALAQLRARAAGSPAEILPSVIGQLRAMRQQYAGASQAIARRLGLAGGGQVQREQAQLLGQAGRQYGSLLTGTQQASLANLLNMQAAFQPALSGAARPPAVRFLDQPFNAAPYGAGLASLLSTARTISDYYRTQPAAPTPLTAMAPASPALLGPEFYP